MARTGMEVTAGRAPQPRPHRALETVKEMHEDQPWRVRAAEADSISSVDAEAADSSLVEEGDDKPNPRSLLATFSARRRRRRARH
mmetsp:Transcript_674/g.4391  ORF Transcript_674/g.4391 Transcript_674/m.4391 type:complete len:85 (-) Transcript_674:1166-1420(-)